MRRPPSSHSEPLIDRLLAPFARFAAAEASGGIVLLACAVLALAWANSPWAPTYERLWHLPLGIGTESVGIRMSLRHWINDGLMVIFFFLVGLEIKRELLVGELSSPRHAALPIASALGGMLVPALLYTTLNVGHPGQNGWGIPMATDIAFALGVLTLLGPRVPIGLKVFLTALAIVDDLGAVLVIAFFYTSTIDWLPLAIGLGAIALAAVGNATGIRRTLFYVAIGLIAWIGMLQSGVHATIAGVLLALTIPARSRISDTSEEDRAPLDRMEQALHGVVAFGIMPLFALANAGVALTGTTPIDGGHLVTLGAVLGLVIGKPLGITLFAWIAAHLRLATLPTGASWRTLHGVSWLGGIGFTMSLFVAGLAFGESPLLNAAKIGILSASCAAGIIGWFMLRNTRQ